MADEDDGPVLAARAVTCASRILYALPLGVLAAKHVDEHLAVKVHAVARRARVQQKARRPEDGRAHGDERHQTGNRQAVRHEEAAMRRAEELASMNLNHPCGFLLLCQSTLSSLF
jgi:hypothetical protein